MLVLTFERDWLVASLGVDCCGGRAGKALRRLVAMVTALRKGALSLHSLHRWGKWRLVIARKWIKLNSCTCTLPFVKLGKKPRVYSAAQVLYNNTNPEYLIRNFVSTFAIWNITQSSGESSNRMKVFNERFLPNPFSRYSAKE